MTTRSGLRPLLAAGALVTATLSLWASAPAHAAGETCDGKPATIVVSSGGDVVGTPDDDVIVVTTADSGTVDGLGGDDTICGGASTFQISGGEGDDDLWSNAVSNPDTFRFAAFLSGGPGNDALHGDDEPEQLEGGTGDDVLLGGGGDDRIAGETDVTSPTAPSSDDDTIDAGAGDDTVIDDWGDDQLAGGDGHDALILGVAGDDPVDDRCPMGALATNAVLDVGAGTVTGFGSDTFAAFETYVGGTTPSTIIGTAGPDDLRSGDCGRAHLIGGRGADRLEGDSADGGILSAQAGSDTVFVSGPYVVRGDEGDDRIHVQPSDFAGLMSTPSLDLRGRLRGGPGTDWVIDDSSDFSSIDLRHGLNNSSGTVPVLDVENVHVVWPSACVHYVLTGSRGRNVLVADPRLPGSTDRCHTVMKGLGGNDRLLAGRHDTAFGGPGHDVCRAQRRVGCEAH
jgi:Ca2+-binding RTX toxin-like protein